MTGLTSVQLVSGRGFDSSSCPVHLTWPNAGNADVRISTAGTTSADERFCRMSIVQNKDVHFPGSLGQGQGERRRSKIAMQPLKRSAPIPSTSCRKARQEVDRT